MTGTKCPKCGCVVKKKIKARKELNLKKIREFENLGECVKSPSKMHRLKMIGYPNHKVWGARIIESFYDFHCIDCQGEFHIPYIEIQKEVEV